MHSRGLVEKQEAKGDRCTSEPANSAPVNPPERYRNALYFMLEIVVRAICSYECHHSRATSTLLYPLRSAVRPIRSLCLLPL